MSEPDYVQINREQWAKNAPEYAEWAGAAWESETSWGIWGVPEADLNLLPSDMSGMKAIELGCGTGYISAWMHGRGADVVGLDPTPEQLATARRLGEEKGVDIDWVDAYAEDVPFPDESFDFAISEYGAAIWSDPALWLPEAWRILKPGSELVFLGNHPFVILTQRPDSEAPASRQLLTPYFGMYRIDWDDGNERSTEFCLPISDWMKLFDQVGFDIVEYHELQAPRRGAEIRYYASWDWANDFPTEQVWKLRKRS